MCLWGILGLIWILTSKKIAFWLWCEMKTFLWLMSVGNWRSKSLFVDWCEDSLCFRFMVDGRRLLLVRIAFLEFWTVHKSQRILNCIYNTVKGVFHKGYSRKIGILVPCPAIYMVLYVWEIHLCRNLYWNQNCIAFFPIPLNRRCLFRLSFLLPQLLENCQ